MPRAAGNSSYYELGLIRGGQLDGAKFKVPSVTSILDVLSKPALLHWYYRGGLSAGQALAGLGVPVQTMSLDELDAYAKETGVRPRDQVQKAAARGTNAHAALEALVTSPPDQVADADEFTGYSEGVWNWYHATSREYIACEEFLFSKTYWYAGTCDLVYDTDFLPGEPLPGRTLRTLCDLKTSKRVYPEMALQLAAYKQAYEEMTGEQIDRTTILLVREDGTFEETEVKGDFEQFLHAKEIFEWRERQR